MRPATAITVKATYICPIHCSRSQGRIVANSVNFIWKLAFVKKTDGLMLCYFRLAKGSRDRVELQQACVPREAPLGVSATVTFFVIWSRF